MADHDTAPRQPRNGEAEHAETSNAGVVNIDRAVANAGAGLCSAGDWLTATQRRAAWVEVRDARSNPLDATRREALSPSMVVGSHAATDELSAEAVEVLHRIASDPGRLSRSWADDMMATLGEEVYVELVGIAATAMTLDTFAAALGRELHSVDGVESEVDEAGPAAIRPDDVGDVGAWVSQTVGDTMANVSRSLSLTPVQNAMWVDLVQTMYSRGAEFAQLEWNRALSRPQVELVAARTTAELECFY